MRYHLEPVPGPHGSHPLVAVTTSFGSAVVGWHGTAHSMAGEYGVEWTVEQDLAWNDNAHPASTPGPGLSAQDSTVMLRGRLDLTPDGAAILDVDGSLVLFDLTHPVPQSVNGTWIEIHCHRDAVYLTPYTL
ncbi:hypothetical protein [Streptomyces sp. MNP-20]|uniref:hypothetical protein n=1 Tax=Streptomyces sp. MNP-20 TaxID=2721165 RepID=UPI001553E351|nr:hypothetical protein [Streptomyces sp. MNP-20]